MGNSISRWTGVNLESSEMATNKYGERRIIEVPENNGLVISGLFIPQEIIEVMLSHFASLPGMKLSTIRLVCSEWNNATRTVTFFKQLFEQLGLPWNCVPDEIKMSERAADVLYIALRKDGFRQNFVLNPSGEHGMRYWHPPGGTAERRARQERNELFVTENPPIGCEPLPSSPNTCFATSYVFLEISQEIDFGLTDEAIKLMTPFEVRFSVETCARFDCGGMGSFRVAELNNKGSRANLPQLINRLSIHKREGETTWETYSFAAYFPSGKKYVAPKFVISFGGKDTKFWAGHYGLKFTHIKAVIKLLSSSEVENPDPEFPRTEVVPPN